MKIWKRALAASAFGLGLMVSLPAMANPDVVKKSVETWLKGRYLVDEVRKTGMPGMYEVRMGQDLIYVEEKGQYAFLDGIMFDMKNDRNLTQERKDWIGRVDFKTLPFDLAIKQVNGTGKSQVAVFEDPNCGHCRNMRRELLKLENTTIYTFAVPILAEDSATKIKQAYCAKDKLAAWNALMLEGRTPASKGDCATPLGKLVELGKRLNVTGTPTILFTSGRRVPGSIPLTAIRNYLNEKAIAEPS
jgi:thiol:disulfide interchange protein DsbC